MSGSVNKVIIVGNLGRDPEVRSFANGGKVCNLNVATSETWMDKNSGERKERTEWHRVSITNDALVKVAEQYLKKGSKVYIEGQLETRKWTDQAGVEKFSTEIAVKPFNGVLTMLDGPSGGEQREERQERKPDGYGAGGRPDLDQEIPFAPEWR